MTDEEILVLLDELDESLEDALRAVPPGETGFLYLTCLSIKIANARFKLTKENKDGLQQHEK